MPGEPVVVLHTALEYDIADNIQVGDQLNYLCNSKHYVGRVSELVIRRSLNPLAPDSPVSDVVVLTVLDYFDNQLLLEDETFIPETKAGLSLDL